MATLLAAPGTAATGEVVLEGAPVVVVEPEATPDPEAVPAGTVALPAGYGGAAEGLGTTGTGT